MFEENAEFCARVDALVAACAAKSRGEIITHEEIGKILACEPYRGEWTYAVDKMKRRVERELGVTLWAEREVGYKLLTDAEQLDMAPRARIKRSVRQIHKAIKHVNAVDTSELSDHMKAKQAFVQSSLARRRSELHGETIRQGIFAKRNDPPPPRISYFK